MVKARTLVSIAAALLLSFALVPTVALANGEETTTGSFTVQNAAPDVTAVELYSNAGCTTVAYTMDPQITYYLKVGVTDHSTLADITEIEAKIYYDSAGTDPDESFFDIGEPHTLAILTWTDTPSWDIDAGTVTSWDLVTGSCVAPSDMSASSGDWIFAFKPGKVARESITPADWDIHARATDDDAETDGMYCLDKGMNWYGEIKAITPTVGFGSVTMGCIDVISTGAVSVTYISNGAYDARVKSAASWGGSSTVILNVGGSPGPGEFSMKADDDPTLAGAVQVTTTYTTFDSGTITGESGNTETANYLWLSLGSSGIPDETYSGTIYYSIVNG